MKQTAAKNSSCCSSPLRQQILPQNKINVKESDWKRQRNILVAFTCLHHACSCCMCVILAAGILSTSQLPCVQAFHPAAGGLSKPDESKRGSSVHLYHLSAGSGSPLTHSHFTSLFWFVFYSCCTSCICQQSKGLLKILEVFRTVN